MLNEIDLARIDLNLLVLFEAVLQEGHVGKAAQRLHLSPSAVSHGLNRLRRLLDDPVFIKHPRGVVPTDRALAVAPAIADILCRARVLLSVDAKFLPATSRRRFSIGAPDGVSVWILPRLIQRLGQTAPGIDLSLKVLWPGAEGEALDAREIDLAVVPVDTLGTRGVAPRFEARPLYEESFVIAARQGHPWLSAPTLGGYCAASHALVSPQGDPTGFIDAGLAAQGLRRRVSVTAPGFLFALAAIAGTDLLTAVPLRLAAAHCERYGLAWAPAPLALARFQIAMLAPTAAWSDAGVQWLAEQLGVVAGA